jgi:hypothetical protein
MEARLLNRIRSDPESSFKRGAAERQIDAAQKRLGLCFPQSYRQFLRHFNGGEFRFAGMYRIIARGAGYFDLLEWMANVSEYFAAFRDRELLLFGDDYSRNYYCFDLAKADRRGECPVVYWDHLLSEKRGPVPEAPSFRAFLVKGLGEAEPA